MTRERVRQCQIRAVKYLREVFAEENISRDEIERFLTSSD